MPKSDITRPANAPASAQTYGKSYPGSTQGLRREDRDDAAR